MTATTRPTLDLEQFFTRRVRLVGGFVLRIAPRAPGLPDRVVLIPGSGAYFVELRSARSKTTPAEGFWREKMNQLGSPVYVLTGREEVLSWIRSVVNFTEAQNPAAR